MRMTLTTDDGEVLGTWTLPNDLAPGQIELTLAAGLYHQHGLDRCDRCGGFFDRQTMVDVSDDDGPTVTCQPCADLPD